jgi:hypothetical protein
VRRVYQAYHQPAPATIPPRDSTIPGRRETADLKLATAAARAAELRMAAAREGEPTQVSHPPPGATFDESTGGETAEIPRPPEVVIVKMPETGGRGTSPALWGLLGVAAAAGIVFGVPSIRERVWNLGGPPPVTRADTDQPAVAPLEDTTPAEVEQARKAIRNLGFKESNKVQAALQRVIDDPKRSPQAMTQARLTQAELVLMRALACKIAVTIEPAAMGGQAQTRSVEDPVYAQELLASIGNMGELPAPDPADPNAAANAALAEQLRRVRALQALVEGKPAGELPPGSEELAALIKGAPLWRNEVRTPPAGLITSLQRLANPSTLSQSLLALALWRSGDVEGSRTLLRTILDRVSDQPAARTMLEALDRQDMLAENGDPELAVPPSDPEPEPELPPEPADPTAGSETPTPTPAIPGDGKTGPVRTTPGVAQERVEVLISTGCQKVRQGDPMGVKLLLDAVDRGADRCRTSTSAFASGRASPDRTATTRRSPGTRARSSSRRRTATRSQARRDRPSCSGAPARRWIITRSCGRWTRATRPRPPTLQARPEPRGAADAHRRPTGRADADQAQTTLAGQGRTEGAMSRRPTRQSRSTRPASPWNASVRPPSSDTLPSATTTASASATCTGCTAPSAAPSWPRSSSATSSSTSASPAAASSSMTASSSSSPASRGGSRACCGSFITDGKRRQLVFIIIIFFIPPGRR